MPTNLKTRLIASSVHFFATWLMRRTSTCLAVLAAILLAEIAEAAPVIVNLSANSLGYDPLNGSIYASVPFNSPNYANDLMPINPGTGALGTVIPIGTRLGQIAVATGGTYVYKVANDGHGVQRYNVTNNSLDMNFTMPGSGEFFQSVRQLYAIPGQPNSVLIERGLGNFSPPAVATGVWQNGVELSQTVGHGLGVGGPDILAVGPTGTTAYGYQNSVSSYGTWAMAIDNNGVHQTQLVIDGPISGNIGHIAAAGNTLFDNSGGIYDVTNSFARIGSFLTDGNFCVDPSLNKFFSVDSIGSNKVIRVYDLGSLQQLGLIAVTGIGTPSTNNLIRVGVNGLAFATSNGQIVVVNSSLVPEPSSLVLAAVGLAGLAAWGWRRRAKLT